VVEVAGDGSLVVLGANPAVKGNLAALFGRHDFKKICKDSFEESKGRIVTDKDGVAALVKDALGAYHTNLLRPASRCRACAYLHTPLPPRFSESIIGINAKKTDAKKAQYFSDWPPSVDYKRKIMELSWRNLVTLADYIASKVALTPELTTAIAAKKAGGIGSDFVPADGQGSHDEDGDDGSSDSD